MANFCFGVIDPVPGFRPSWISDDIWVPARQALWRRAEVSQWVTPWSQLRARGAAIVTARVVVGRRRPS